ncbi:MAG: PAS domain-containing protein [Pseudomonadales bacterium]|nr:PAS domain-containing protein [Pseudomonadales bacterium]MBO7005970.1 PAS domain-containing protein [Pseudomonadales bacterium]
MKEHHSSQSIKDLVYEETFLKNQECLVLVDGDFRILAVNLEWEELTGYTSSDCIGRPAQDFVIQADLARLNVARDEYFNGEALTLVNIRLRHKRRGFRRVSIFATSRPANSVGVVLAHIVPIERSERSGFGRYDRLFDDLNDPLATIVACGDKIRTNASRMNYRKVSEDTEHISRSVTAIGATLKHIRSIMRM